MFVRMFVRMIVIVQVRVCGLLLARQRLAFATVLHVHSPLSVLLNADQVWSVTRCLLGSATRTHANTSSLFCAENNKRFCSRQTTPELGRGAVC